MVSFLINRLVFSSFLNELERFHGQDVYQNMGKEISKKKPYFKVILFIVEKLLRFQFFNFVCIFMVILFFDIYRYPFKNCRVLQIGRSYNNIVSLQRLNRCLGIDLAKDISLGGCKATTSDKIKVLSSFKSIWFVSGMLSNFKKNRPLTHIQMIIGSATFIFYSFKPLSSNIKVVCVASDHSPINQAILFIARFQNIKTCYIQHAPVSDYFPPLNFDLSILYDKASELAYEYSALRYGMKYNSKVILLSPFSEIFIRPTLKKSPYNIGICLSLLPNFKTLKTVIKKVCESKDVDNIILRSHPRCKLTLMPLLINGKVRQSEKDLTAKDFFKLVDIVLVPNSGVAVEALHSGKPTFFVPDTDGLPNDYYGFISKGILPEFQDTYIENLQLATSFFDDEWVKRFSMYDATINQDQLQQCNEIRQVFTDLLS